jgi:putative membrane protein
VQDAEAGTSGEVVVFVVDRSDAYEAVLWRGAALGILAAVLVWLLLSLGLTSWGTEWLWAPTFLIVLLGVGSVLGAGLVHRSGTVFRLVAGRRLPMATVRARAERVFLSEGVAETAGRTGILLFVSVLERRIEVLADRGINAAVSPEHWQEVVDLVSERLRSGDIVGGLSAGISACGDLLRSSGLEAADDDQNELADDVRLGGE